MQRRGSRSALVVAGVVAAALLAFALRSLGFETTFLPDGSVAFHFTDANYHARRALWTMLNFPRVLAIDPYLNYPHGATVPWPPLLDWLVAAVSLVLGGSVRVFERVAAWTPPLLGALAVLPIYGLGRLIRGPGVGIGAALIFACLPLVVQYGQVGNYDHHAAMAPLGGLLLLCYASALDERTRGRALLAALLGLVASRIALMLVWQGNLLYLGPCELAFTGLAVVARRRDLLGAQALGALFTSAAIAPLVSGGGPLIGGPWSAIELSRLHVTAFVCISVVSGGLLALDRLRPAKSGGAELRRALCISALLGGLLLVLPGPREGLQSAFDFVTRADEYGATNLENQRLFLGTGRLGHLRALQQVALYAYLVPVAALALLWEARRRRESRHALLLLALWAGLLGAMALTQRRYMNDFAPVGCAAFALLLAQVGDLLRERRIGPDWLPRLAPPVLGVALLLPAIPTHVAALRQTLARSGADAVGTDRAAETAKGALLRFGQAVREATPATASLYGPGPPPEYSILGFVGIGHVLHYVAERPTPADNFGPYIGRENFRTVLDYFLLADEEEAVATARRLGARYVATSLPRQTGFDVLQQRLHVQDGSDRDGRSAWEHFRLVTEGPAGGVPFSSLFGATSNERTIPYKLFEVVEGARLRVEARPDTRVSARIEVETPTGRRFHWIIQGRTDEHGVATLRVPYATRTELPTRPLGPYRVRVAGREATVHTDDADVQEGREVRVRVG